MGRLDEPFGETGIAGVLDVAAAVGTAVRTAVRMAVYTAVDTVRDAHGGGDDRCVCAAQGFAGHPADEAEQVAVAAEALPEHPGDPG